MLGQDLEAMMRGQSREQPQQREEPRRRRNPLGGLGRKVKGVSGAVDLEGGDVALVLDLQNLLRVRSTRL